MSDDAIRLSRFALELVPRDNLRAMTRHGRERQQRQAPGRPKGPEWGVTPLRGDDPCEPFDVQPVFEFLRNPANLPQWAHAFTSVQDGRARLETGAGAVDVRLGVSADAETGTLDRRGADRSVGRHDLRGRRHQQRLGRLSRPALGPEWWVVKHRGVALAGLAVGGTAALLTLRR